MNGRVPPSRTDAGDLEGLPDTADVEEESVENLADTGQGFEADVVTGVEEAGDHPERPVHTHDDKRTDDFPVERRRRAS